MLPKQLQLVNVNRLERLRHNETETISRPNFIFELKLIIFKYSIIM